ncbi:electron transfer flavoprotein subunit alpha/FixB family protein [Vallitalea okinawensis]|uniref:electron transfer flavoprotein subunit alpha/FixB family protein n=1 Tax=Vallitalea okinawensis TaxID=2078660 RepID=UPI000CFDD451|nr:FAD-binding protein [Vallitalea okinawensis]
MNITVIISDFAGEHETYFKQLKSFIKDCIASVKVIVITDKASQYASIVDRIDVIEFEAYDSEVIANYIAKHLEPSRKIIFDSSILSRELAGRLSYKLNIPGLIDVRAMKSNNESVIFTKHVYAANLVAEFETIDFCITLSKTVPKSEESLKPSTINKVHQVSMDSTVKVLSVNPILKEKDKDMLIVIGRGVDVTNDLNKIKTLTAHMDADLGASRPICMGGYVSLEHLVGVSGKIYSPKICITLGVSGALAFYPGIEKSKVIISINEDKDAPIMKYSDYCIQSDYKDIVNYLEGLYE